MEAKEIVETYTMDEFKDIIQQENLEIFDFFLTKKSITNKSTILSILLIYSIRAKQNDKVDFLLEIGADYDSLDSSANYDALFQSILSSNLEALKSLHKKGLDIFRKYPEWGNSESDLMAIVLDLEIFKYFEQNGAVKENIDKILARLIKNSVGKVDFLKYLIEKYNVDIKSINDLNSPFNQNMNLLEYTKEIIDSLKPIMSPDDKCYRNKMLEYYRYIKTIW